MNVFVDYAIAEECSNTETIYICHKCGECGRKFDAGIMIDDGGTHVLIDDEVEE